MGFGPNNGMCQFNSFHTVPTLMTMKKKSFENIVGKGAFSPFYAPASKDRGHIVLLLSVYPSVCLSVCPSICLHKLNMKSKHFLITPKLI